VNYSIIDNIINTALFEDINQEDITTNSIVSDSSLAVVDLIAKEDGIICGLDVFSRVFELLGGVKIQAFFKDGDPVKTGQLVAKIEGKTRTVLSGERVALNLLQRMSGIATYTNGLTKLLEGTGIKLMDTRKTTPNLRYLEKYSVKIGGGFNHRYNLSDMAMIKDNHIMAAGGIKEAVEAVRGNYPFVKLIEVEAETIDGVEQALEAGADIIMLDNMDLETIKKAVKLIDKKAVVEVSGNVDAAKVNSLRGLAVDYISCGALTHSVKALDLSMKNLKILI
jgi:nicotinate-nucleotide pyrophosphorylase (carboxylating)